MNIAHIVCTYPPYFGGMGNSAFHMAEGLAARGHDVQVYTPLYTETPDIETQATVQRVAPSFAYGNAAILPNMHKLLKDMDIVHLHYPFFGVAGKIRRLKKKYPNLSLVTSYHMDPRGNNLVGMYMKWYARQAMPKVLTASDVITVSTFDFARASEAKDLYASEPNKWHELPFGVDTDRFIPTAYSEQLRFLYNATKVPLFLFVGGMDSAHHFKGVPTLLRAFREASRERDMRLVLVGDGDERPMFEALALALGIADSVYFAGAVSDAELPAYYATADCTILPSTSTAEAFGMVLLESMASGTPVIASDLPGVRQIAALGGITSTTGDVEQLAESLSAFDPLSEEATRVLRAKIVSSYTWDAVVDRLESIYADVSK
jgi:glycosyltransferase involved in cell wall biosynthesis